MTKKVTDNRRFRLPVTIAVMVALLALLGVLLCSWGCVRRREKRRTEAELRAAEKRNRKKLTPAQKEGLIRQKVYSGMTNEEISAETGMSVQLVNYYRKKIEEAFET